jgi:putative intracellular protease/amidase
MTTKKRRILIVLSEHGFWGEELIGPLHTVDQAGYQVDFATPKVEALENGPKRYGW